jgi:hypothetical protein
MDIMNLASNFLPACLSVLMLPAVASGQAAFAGANINQEESGIMAAIPLIRLTASFTETSDHHDYTVIYFDDKATIEFDGQLDALKLMNTEILIPNLYTITPGGTNLSINALPPAAKSSSRVALGVKTNASGFITFKICDIDSSLSMRRVFLTDTTTGLEQNLLPDLEYKVYLSAGEYPGRFFMTVTDISAEIRQEYSENNAFTVYHTSGLLKAVVNNLTGEDGTLTVYDLTGQAFLVTKIYEPGQYEYHPNIKEGIYMVSLVSGRDRTTRKIFIKN